MNQVLIKEGPQFEVQLAKGLLDDRGIPCYVSSEHGEGFVLSTGGILESYYLYVRPEDEAEAREICELFAAD